MKYTILDGDFKQIYHPVNPTKIVKVRRIYYLKDVILGDFSITKDTIGGYIGDDSCLSQTDNSMVLGNSVVLNSTKLINSVVKDDAIVFGESTLTSCLAHGKATVGGKISARNSSFGKACLVHGSFDIQNSILTDNCRVEGRGKIKETEFHHGSCIVNADATVENSRLEDYAEINGTTIVKDSVLSGRVVVKDANIIRQNLSVDYQLNIVQGKNDL